MTHHRMGRPLLALSTTLALLLNASPAAAKVVRDRCENDGNSLDLKRVEATLTRPDGVKTWTYVIETCEAFSPTDLRAAEDHFAMGLHFDTSGDDGRHERTIELYNCNASADQICAEMTAGHAQGGRFGGGPRKIGEPDATQSSPTTVTVSFPNRWLGKRARNRTGFTWRARSADEIEPGVITFDYAPDGRLPREHP